ncbi:MAG TPA: MarR family winged helix-turn-helix transcriptional regulator [Ktedonobacterales bacterium]
MSNSTNYESVMIGALLSIPMQALSRRVTATLIERGFTDYRNTYQPVFSMCRPEGSRLTELAALAGVTKSSMVETIDALVERGYFERVADPVDGRAILIRRTERGWEVNRIAREVVERVQAEWAEALGEERIRDLLETLRQLAIYLDEPLGASGHAKQPKHT